MSIGQLAEKIKNITLPANSEAGEEVSFDNTGHIEQFPLFRKLFLSLVIILVASLSFGIGRLTGVGKSEPIQIEYDQELTTNNLLLTAGREQAASVINSLPSQLPNLQTSVVASKSGSKYHFLHCPGAKQIKEANKLTFPNPGSAEAAGYSLAANCVAK
ncbi:MAG: hypothetical protein AAB758_00715 [Patescibacteria group bacterium]